MEKIMSLFIAVLIVLISLSACSNNLSDSIEDNNKVSSNIVVSDENTKQETTDDKLSSNNTSNINNDSSSSSNNISNSTSNSNDSLEEELPNNDKTEEKYEVLDSGKCGDNLFWELRSNGTLKIYGTGAMYDYVKYSQASPWYKYRNEPYVSQDGRTIYNPDGSEYMTTSAYIEDNPNGWKIKKIVIDKGVTYLGDWAFYRVCVDELIIPEGVESTGYFCIRYSPTLKSVKLPNSLKVLNDFGISRNTELKKIDFGQGLTTIGRCGLAQNTSLEEVILPQSVVSINEFLHEKYNGNAGDNMGLLDGCKSLKKVSFGGVEKIPQRTCLNNEALEEVYISKNVKSIEEYAFANCSSLKKVVFEEGTCCKEIGKSAFFNCKNLEKVIGATAIENIKINAFTGAYSLNEFTFSDTNVSFAQNQFYNTKIKQAAIGPNVKIIPKMMFGYGSIEEAYIASRVMEIKEAAFHSCPLKKIYYDGTISQWRNIVKASDWANNTPTDCVVYFSDGTTELLSKIK